MEYFNVRLSQNRLEVNVPAVNASITDRTRLRYYLDICVPKSYQNPEFQALIRLEASEVPPYEKLDTTIYEGAYFPIENYLDSLLTRKAPLFNQESFVLCEDLTMPFYLIATRMNGDELIDTVQMPIEYILKGGINESDYPKWKEIIFKSELGLAGKFLTWGIDNKVVDASQPEFLYFLTNFTPIPSILHLKVRKIYLDGTNSIAGVFSLSGILAYSVYSFPISINILGIDTDPKEVISYEVWLENELNERVSEIRTYQVERMYNRNVKYILFSNSLGGFDTLRALGQSIESLKVSRQMAERYYPFGASATYSERIINQVTGVRELIIRTGFISKAELDYLQEVILAKEFYLVTDREFIPLMLTSEQYVNQEDDVNIRGREFVFSYSNREYNYSRLVIPPSAIARTKAWRAFGSPVCLLNEHGKRTGLGQFDKLEQYYTDDNSAVIPQMIKPNISGTEGFAGPVQTDLCSSTPFLNVRIVRASTFRYTGCLNPYIGNYPELIIEAGVWGSEISQADADAKAEAEWTALNTQAYADTHGECVLMRYLNVEIRRQGTLRKNDCVMVGYIGTTAEIVINANVYGSDESQEAADALAEAAFEAIDTQAYANEHGTCEYNFENGLKASYYSYYISQNLDESFFDTAEPYLERSEVRIDHGDGQFGNPSIVGYPIGFGHDDYTAVRFKGFIKAPITGTIRLYIRVADDEWAALYLNNSTVKTLEKPDHSSPSEVFVDIHVVENEYIPFELRYIEFSGFNLTKLSWSYAGQPKIVIPDASYYRLII